MRVRNLLWKTGENARESEEHSKGRCVRVCVCVNKYDYYLNIYDFCMLDTHKPGLICLAIKLLQRTLLFILENAVFRSLC